MARTLDLATLRVLLTAEAGKYQQELKKSKQDTRTFGTDMKKLIGGAATAGFAVAGVAATKFVSESVRDFNRFDNATREVFTLLPDLSREAMDSMRDDILDYSTDVGRTTDEVIPALYQAISAGVPADNVFDFLTTAHKAALGGVTELETAVDGITSVVNAYGVEVMDATDASDLMFTAVRLGKTTFDELSRSLFNVTPTAAALGVEFSDLTAALASMTAQGVPTTVATTQLRQLLVELSKDGSQAAATFERLAGTSFRDFIAQGGNLQGALAIMEEAAADANVGVNDLFGSVEAGGAALALTGQGTETFTRNLEEMESAAGATAAASETMSDSGVRAIEEMQAAFEALRITVGEELAPEIAEMARDVGEAVRWIGKQLRAGDVRQEFIELTRDADEFKDTWADIRRLAGREGIFIDAKKEAELFARALDLVNSGLATNEDQLLGLLRAEYETDLRTEALVKQYQALYGQTEAVTGALDAQKPSWQDILSLTQDQIEAGQDYIGYNEALTEALKDQKPEWRDILSLTEAQIEAGQGYRDVLYDVYGRTVDATAAAGNYTGALFDSRDAAEAFRERVNAAKNEILGISQTSEEKKRAVVELWVDAKREAEEARRKIADVNSELDRLDGKTVDVGINIRENRIRTELSQPPADIPRSSAPATTPTPTTPTPQAGGPGVTDPTKYGDFQHGGSFVVPYTGDFKLGLHAGELVDIEPRDGIAPGGGGRSIVIEQHFYGPTNAEDVGRATREALDEAGRYSEYLSRRR